jgi:hypothetical protein
VKPSVEIRESLGDAPGIEWAEFSTEFLSSALALGIEAVLEHL